MIFSGISRNSHAHAYIKPFCCWNWMTVGEIGQYHGCWWPGSLRRQDISSNAIDYAGWTGPGPWFSVKMTLYQYRKFHCGDKTVVRSSYLYNGISYTGKMSSLYWTSPLVFQDEVCLAPEPSQYWEMLGNTNVILCFVKVNFITTRG